MEKIIDISYSRGNETRVYIEFESGRRAHFDIREVDGKRKMFANETITLAEMEEVKKVAKVGG